MANSATEMTTQIEASKAFTYRLTAKMQAGKSVIKEISMAKNFATDVSDKVTYDAVQIFGGMGFMRKLTTEHLYRDNRILAIGGDHFNIITSTLTCHQFLL